MNALNNT